jgi:hypothetical protein
MVSNVLGGELEITIACVNEGRDLSYHRAKRKCQHHLLVKSV